MLRVNGHELFLREAGPADGRLVVLLHTGLGSTADWRDHLGALASRGYRAVAYDRWGYGRSAQRAQFAPPHFQADVDDLTALLGALGRSRAALVGHSDGGTIALDMAARHPERVAALVVVAAHVYVEVKTVAGIRALQSRHACDPAMSAALLRRHGPKAGPLAEAWFRAWSRPEAWLWDMRARLGAVRCPTLVVQGEADEFATVTHARRIAAAVSGARLWLEPGVGHLLPQTVPDAFGARLISFLTAAGWPPAAG